MYDYQRCPYAQVSQLQLHQSNLPTVQFKTSNDPYKPWNSINQINQSKGGRSKGSASPPPSIRWGANVVKENH